MKHIRNLILVVLVIWGTNVSAQVESDVSGVGTTAAAFLEIGVGARAMAMGGSYAAVADDPTALYYNPAGIVWSQNIQLELTHAEWLVDTDYDFAGITLPLPFFNSSLGVSLTMLNYGEQIVRRVDFPEGTGEVYGARDYAFSLTYSTALTNRFGFGLSGKFINQKIWNESASQMALDLGVLYKTAIEGLQLGMSISNFGGKMRLSGRDLHTSVDPDENNSTIDDIRTGFLTDGFALPVLFRAGISYKKEFGSVGSILLTTDLNHPANSTESINVGMEYGYAGIFFLRGGYESAYERDAINGLTLGGGVDYYKPGSLGYRVDYAFADWGPFQSVHRFSLGLTF